MAENHIIRCLVIDDEHLSVKLITDYILKTPGLELVLATSQVQEGLSVVEKGGVDLIFLDIQMPEMTGLQFMKIAGDRCRVVFTTAYSQYAVESYEYNAVDYLLKPITFERFLDSIQKARRWISSEPSREKAEPAKKDHLFVKTAYRIQKVDLASIYYLEALRDYIAIHLQSSKILTLDSMKNMEEVLPADQFVRIHKSYIINKNRIDFLSRGKVVVNNVYLPVGDTYKERFQQIIGI